MTSGEIKAHLRLRKAVPTDIDGIKKVVDTVKHELGFVTRPALLESVKRREVYLAFIDSEVVGVIHYRHRRDGQTTLYHLAVIAAQRHYGIGRRLVNAMQGDAKRAGQTSLLLKCPVDLPANNFYHALGFDLLTSQDGKSRRLNVWHKRLTTETQQK